MSSMNHRNRIHGLLLASLCAACGGESSEIAPAIDSLCAGGSGATVAPSSASVVLDGNRATTFGSGNNGWQYLTIDLGCARKLSGFRRYLVRDERTRASRTNQGESWQYSADGITWKYLTANNSFGWESYQNYGATLQAWHSVGYDWSKWLRPTVPVNVRFIRYHWDGSYDSVAEVELDIRVVSSSHAAIDGTSRWNVIDETSSRFETGNLGWQSVTIDLGRTVRLSRVRRWMSGAGSNRGAQGEGWAVSSDGNTFQNLVGSEVIGWQSYVNYQPHAWHSIPYGWSAWLELKSPRLVRFVRFNWDGNSDALAEIGIDEVKPATDSSYDFSWTDGNFNASLPSYAGSLSPPSTWSIMIDPAVGFSGFYQGEIYSNVGSGSNSRVSATLVQDGAGEVRGIITVQEGLTSVYFDGFGCSNKIIPAGTRWAVRMQVSSNDGRFGEAGAWDYNRFSYVSGSTSRTISGFGVGGTATFDFHGQLWNKGAGSGSPASFLSVYVDYATPCTDGPPLLLYLTRDNTVLRRMVGL
jgi:hypothetical protein